MEIILNLITATASRYPIRTLDPSWGEIEYRFDLPNHGATARDLERASQASGLPLPESLQALLRQWDGPRFFQIWKSDETPPLEEIRFYSTALLTKAGKGAVQGLNDSGRSALVIANAYGCELLMEPDREWVIIHRECVGRYYYLCSSLAGFLAMALREGPTRTPIWADERSWTPME